MKKFFLIFLLFAPMLVQAQAFRLDTIQVAPDDPRRIQRTQPQPQAQPQQTPQQQQYIVVSGEQPTTEEAQPVPPRNNLDPFMPNFDRKNLRFGANLGLSRSRDQTTIALGPQIGYQFSDFFMAGTGIKYHYIRMNTNRYDARHNLLGVNVFGFFYPVSLVALFVQPEINHIWRSVRNNETGERVTERGTVPVLLVGAGLRLGRSSHITLNYDLVRHIHSPYPETVFLSVSAFF